MRLIDADKLIDYFYYGEDDKPIIDGIADRKIIDIIKNQPTAYDVEKVVGEIKKLDSPYDADAWFVRWFVSVKLDKAITIVRKGGVE